MKSHLKVIFDASKKTSPQKKKQILEDFGLIHPLAGEKVLCVQRQHIIALIFPMLFPLLGLILLLTLLFFSQKLFFFSFFNSLYIFYLVLTAVAAILIFETFIFMRWYYQFYIITNRCIMHIHFFRLGGYHIDEVFLERIKEQEIDRKAPNLLLDLFDIEDVYVYFPHLEREAPFIFNMPSNPKKIEDILKELTA